MQSCLGAVLASCALVVACGDSDDQATARPAPPSDVIFADVTDASGIDFVHYNGATPRKYLPETMGSGGCALDFDGDGWMDLYLVQSGVVPGTGDRAGEGINRLYRNRGDGTFEDVTDSSGTGDRGYGMGAAAADCDGDGDTDIYVVNLGPNVLLRNEGDGRFVEVTEEAGVGDDRWGSSAAWFDAEGDGDLDLYVVNYVSFDVEEHVDCGDVQAGEAAYCHPDVYSMAADVFYLNRGDGTFEEATRAAGLVDTSGKGLGVVVADFDNDGDPDVYVANDSTPNFLYVNRGDGTFEEEGLSWGVSHNEDGATEAGMGVDAGDVNGDGWIDLVVTNLSLEANSLYLGGPGTFRYVSRESGLHVPTFFQVGFGTDLLDLDLDGDLDLYVGNGHVIDNIAYFSDGLRWKQPSQVFWNDGRGGYIQAAPATCQAIAVPRVARGSITLDYDGDGRLDVLQVFNGDRARLFHNVLPAAGSWIGLELVSTSANRDAVGVRVAVEVAGSLQIEEKKAGASYQTSHDPRLHFGLGRASSCRVTVHWPAGDTTHELAAGSYYRLVEGQEPVPAGMAPGEDGL